MFWNVFSLHVFSRPFTVSVVGVPGSLGHHEASAHHGGADEMVVIYRSQFQTRLCRIFLVTHARLRHGSYTYMHLIPLRKHFMIIAASLSGQVNELGTVVA